MYDGIRWSVSDRYGNTIYLTEERWRHIIEPFNHPEMADNEEELEQTIRLGQRKQDPVNAQKYRYRMAFTNLAEDNTHIEVIVLFRFQEGAQGHPVANNYVVTAYQKELESR